MNRQRDATAEGAHMVGSERIHHYRVADAFKVQNGQIMRDATTAYWRELLDTVVVDISAGTVQLGASGAPVQWQILQRGEPGWDFLAARTEDGDTILSTLRIRLWEAPIQMLIILNGFMFVTGICEMVDADEIPLAQ
jgi:hypothetical protein